MKKLFSIIALSLVMTLSLPAFAFGESAGYTTNRFDVNVDVTDSHVCKVEETIKVNFKEAKHGIFRYIPYEPGIYTVKKIDVDGDPYEVSSEYDNSWNQIIKIGDADRVLKGKHTYNIRYNIVGYEDKDSEKDYLSLDLLPTGWDTSIQASTIKVKLPKAIDADTIQLYGGRYGSTGKEEVEYNYDEKKNVITINAKKLPKGYGITLSAELPEGYWENPANRNWMAVPLTATLIVIPAVMLLLWFLFGRDPKIVKTVEFYPPEGMTPADMGYVIDGSVDYKDVLSLIMYLAEKGYLRITEYDKNRFRLDKLRDIDRSEKTFVRTFFRGLFEAGDSVETDDLPSGFGEDFQLAQQQIKDSYKGKNALFTVSSTVCRIIGFVMMFVPPVISVIIAATAKFKAVAFLGLIPIGLFLVISMLYIINLFDKWDATSRAKRRVTVVIATVFAVIGVGISAVITSILMESAAYGLLVVISTLVTFTAVVLMRKRTERGARLQGQILGFRDFIETAELEKLNMLVEEDPEYFYNIMPYAYVMGLSDKWAKKFEKIRVNQPDWYHGYNSTSVYSMLWYSQMFNSCAKSMESSVINSIVASAADSGGGSIGGGFGGGGFSGGGFGGGGGGSW